MAIVRQAVGIPRGGARRSSTHSAQQQQEQSTIAVVLSAACFLLIVIQSPALERESAAKAAHSKLWAASTRAYEQYYCLTRPTGASCSPARRDVALADLEPFEAGDSECGRAALSHNPGAELGSSCCARGASGSGSSSGGGRGGGGVARTFSCACGKHFYSEMSLRHHQLRYRHGNALPINGDQCVAVEGDASA